MIKEQQEYGEEGKLQKARNWENYKHYEMLLPWQEMQGCVRPPGGDAETGTTHVPLQARYERYRYIVQSNCIAGWAKKRNEDERAECVP